MILAKNKKVGERRNLKGANLKIKSAIVIAKSEIEIKKIKKELEVILIDGSGCGVDFS